MLFGSAARRHATQMRELQALRAILAQMETTMADKFDDLRAAVAAERTVTASAIALIKGLADRITAATEADDRGALDVIVADLRAAQTDLAHAVAEGTGISLAQSAAVSGPLPDSAAAVDAQPANGGTGAGPLDNALASDAPADRQKQAGADGAAERPVDPAPVV